MKGEMTMKKKARIKKTKSPKAKAKKTSAARPKVKNLAQHKYFQDVLNRKRDEILKIVKKKDSDVNLGEIGDEADVASQTFEREMMFEMTNGERMILDDIEAALRKIEKGDFGLCENCHKRISNQRLKAMPWARYCIQCQTRPEAPARAG